MYPLFLLLPVLAGLALLAAVAWILVQLLLRNGHALLRLEALEAQLAAGQAGGVARFASPTAGQPPAAPSLRPAGHNNVALLPAARPVAAASDLPASVPVPARQTSKGYCGQGAAPTRLPVGEAAPPLTLPDLAGATVDLASFRGTRILLLFWNPGCGYCNRMLGDLRAWELTPHKDPPRLLIVSTGTIDANLAMGLRSTVVLDRGFAVARAFGASGTPSAVLIDEHGRIASSVARGAPAVFALTDGASIAGAVTATAAD